MVTSSSAAVCLAAVFLVPLLILVTIGSMVLMMEAIVSMIVSVSAVLLRSAPASALLLLVVVP